MRNVKFPLVSDALVHKTHMYKTHNYPFVWHTLTVVWYQYVSLLLVGWMATLCTCLQLQMVVTWGQSPDRLEGEKFPLPLQLQLHNITSICRVLTIMISYAQSSHWLHDMA